MTNEIVTKSINDVLGGEASYCKFLSANDSGETKAHQSGILISKSVSKMFFTDIELKENHILEKYIKIQWQNDFETDCMIKWYESKNELRITRLGRGFPFLRPDYTGALFVLIQMSKDYFHGYIFNSDIEIQGFLDSFGLTPAETNRPIEYARVNQEIKEKKAIDDYISGLKDDFPSSVEMANAAHIIQLGLECSEKKAFADPDHALISWIQTEYKLFREIEKSKYLDTVTSGFKTLDEFIITANQVLNRRKSRAGKSLEHHLAKIFSLHKISYTSQAITEGRKKPDFLFPSEEAYHDMTFPIDKICTLAAKTTCKDRWRQILNEANRLRDENKYLCTMQQGISISQMDEMHDEKVVLVVPRSYIQYYPKERQNRIWTIKDFLDYVKRIEEI